MMNSCFYYLRKSHLFTHTTGPPSRHHVSTVSRNTTQLLGQRHLCPVSARCRSNLHTAPLISCEETSPVLPVGFVKHHILHGLQLQIHLLDDVHQTAGGPDDAADVRRTSRSHRHNHQTHTHTLVKVNLHVGILMKSSKLVVHADKEKKHTESRAMLKHTPRTSSTEPQHTCLRRE